MDFPKENPVFIGYIPTFEHLLAMKLNAFRVTDRHEGKDIPDIVGLTTIAWNESNNVEDIVDMAAKFFPDIRAKHENIEKDLVEIVRKYFPARTVSGAEPSYAGRNRRVQGKLSSPEPRG